MDSGCEGILVAAEDILDARQKKEASSKEQVIPVIPRDTHVMRNPVTEKPKANGHLQGSSELSPGKGAYHWHCLSPLQSDASFIHTEGKCMSRKVPFCPQHGRDP